MASARLKAEEERRPALERKTKVLAPGALLGTQEGAAFLAGAQ
jgi:hypothetical protein